jgi:hypothetical protein
MPLCCFLWRVVLARLFECGCIMSWSTYGSDKYVSFGIRMVVHTELTLPTKVIQQSMYHFYWYVLLRGVFYENLKVQFWGASLSEFYLESEQCFIWNCWLPRKLGPWFLYPLWGLDCCWYLWTLKLLKVICLRIASYGWFTGLAALVYLVLYHIVMLYFGLNLLVLPKECPAFGFGLDGQWWYQLHVPSVLNCIVILVSDWASIIFLGPVCPVTQYCLLDIFNVEL